MFIKNNEMIRNKITAKRPLRITIFPRKVSAFISSSIFSIFIAAPLLIKQVKGKLVACICEFVRKNDDFMEIYKFLLCEK